jgi:hypothetical protein
MSVFISWAGKDTASYRIAVLLKEFIPQVIQKTDCFISDDIQAGTVWLNRLLAELQNRNIGLVCVTRDNQNSRWLNFEAGAIWKNVGDVSRVCPVLIDLSPKDVSQPLSSFQTKTLKREDVLSICEMVNKDKGDRSLTKEALNRAFGVWWPEFEKALSTGITGPIPQAGASE